MKNKILLILCVLCAFAKAQVGINTTNPQGALDVVSPNTGMVVPRVSAIENVTTPDGNPPVDGTIVYDLSRNTLCIRISGAWVCTNASGESTTTSTDTFETISNYIKASNTNTNDQFGSAISLSTDGNILAVGALDEDSNVTGVNGDQTNNTTSNAGAVYIFTRSGIVWTQEAYIKASNTNNSDRFGSAVSLSADGNTLAVGASGEGSNATGVNGNQTNNATSNAGAVYIFTRSGTVWTQEAYIKASNTDEDDVFGLAVSLSADGNILAVGAEGEDSNATGINGNQTNNAASNTGAVYIFTRNGIVWTQEAYIKASNTSTAGLLGLFGDTVSLSAGGSTLAVGARAENSNATGINGDQAGGVAFSSGAVYIFTRSNTIWTQEAYIKASNAEAGDFFGNVISLSQDGNTLAVGALGEDSNATGVNGDSSNNGLNASGAVYIFSRSGTVWTEEAYLKSFESDANDFFGGFLSLSADGNTLAVAAQREDSNATGINGDLANNGAGDSGAVYIFRRQGSLWLEGRYIKASNTDGGDQFGSSISLNANGNTLVVAAQREDSNATGIGGDQTNNSANSSGAVYVVE